MDPTKPIIGAHAEVEAAENRIRPYICIGGSKNHLLIGLDCIDETLREL